MAGPRGGRFEWIQVGPTWWVAVPYTSTVQFGTPLVPVPPHVAQRQMSSTPRVATHGGRPAAILDLHNDTQIGTLVGFGTRTGGMSPVPL